METSTIERIRNLVTPLVVERGLELYDVESTGGALRVLVDREGGVDLDTIGEVTRAVSTALDDADPIPGRYTLEVSSPGVERTLRTARHFAAAVGETVSVKTVAGTEGERRIDGILVEADEETVAVEAGDGDVRRIPIDRVERARTVFSWGPSPKPGGTKKSRSKKEAPGTGATTRKA